MKDEKVSFKKMRSAFFFGLIVILTVSFLYLIRPFAYPLFWAAVFAVMFHPLYAALNKYIKISGISSIFSVLLIVVLILIPLTLLVLLLVNQTFDLYRSVTRWPVLSDVNIIIDRLHATWLSPYVNNLQQEWQGYVETAANGLTGFIFNQLKVITENSFEFFFMLFLMLYSLYYFFKDGESLLMRLMHLSPLGDHYELLLYERFTSTVRATLRSTFIIGMVQGLLGGIMFWVTGVPGAFVWGVIMGAFSILPAIGSFVVWIPAAAIMLLLGNVWQGVVILVFGTVVISTIDNIIRPPLVGKSIQMHPLIVLFSTLGGILLFGISGFVIGPIIAALFLSVLSIYDYYYDKELRKNV